MLKLLTGISGSGKTHSVLSCIKQHAKQGRRCLYIVPEQFSATAETLIYAHLKDELSAYADVRSFTSFAESVLKHYGGAAVKTLSDAGRIVAVRRAGEKLCDELETYKAHIKNTNFCSMCADVIKELKTAGATPENLNDISKCTGENGKKLKEIALIWKTYEVLLSGIALDTQDRINIAAQKIEPDFLQDTYVFIDNFDGFTPPQYTLIEKFVAAKECTVALCYDTRLQGNSSLFEPVKNTAQRLIRLAQRQNITVQTPENFDENYRHKNCAQLRAVNSILCGFYDEEHFEFDKIEQSGDAVSEREKLYADERELTSSNEKHTPPFAITLCDSVYEQCKIVAAQIIKLVNSGESYKDIAVICREAQNYEQAIKYEFELFDIPYFTDAVSTLEYAAHTCFLRAALSLCTKGINSEGLLRLLKTGLCGYEPQEISALENYAYTWQLAPKEWLEPFKKSPSGFGEQSTLSEDDEQVLNSAERLRSEIVPIITAFISKCGKCTALQISKALYELLQSFNAEQNTVKMAEASEYSSSEILQGVQSAAFEQTLQHLPCSKEELYRTWNTLMSLLDEINALLGDDIISPQEYDELFALLLRSFDVGHVPLTQDVVIFSTADRMRLENPKYCFVLGTAEGEFPKIAGYSGLLTHEDRDMLVQNGIDMPGSFENRTMLEQMFFYRALTAPSKGLFLSALKEEKGGAALCFELANVIEYLKPPKLLLTAAELAPTPNAALDILSLNYRQDNSETAAYMAALSSISSAANSLDAMSAACVPSVFSAHNLQAIQKLVGESLTVSPTKIEQYHKCKFSYFLQYVLRVRARKKAELSPIETGSLVHYILEHTMRKASDAFLTLTEEELRDVAFEITQQYVEKYMPHTSKRFQYLIGRLKDGVLNLLTFLQKEQRQSSFKPVMFEQIIGYNENDAVEPMTLKAPGGKTVRVVGKIDRVDVMQSAGVNYVRVVDYKTGDKTFNLEQVYCGLNIQMLFYLFMICKKTYMQYENPIAAGVLYIQGDPAVKSVQRREAELSHTYKVDGLVLNDETVLKGMDKDATGYYVPVTFGKNGVRASKKLASLEQLGNIEKHIEQTVVQMAKGIYEGQIEAQPLCTNSDRPCNFCDYRAVCRHEDGVNERKISAPDNLFE